MSSLNDRSEKDEAVMESIDTEPLIDEAETETTEGELVLSAHSAIASDDWLAEEPLSQTSDAIHHTSPDMDASLDEIFAAENESAVDEFLSTHDEPNDDAMIESARKIDFSSYSMLQTENSEVFSNALTWTSISTQNSPGVVSYGGLLNLGNTCYMASALQMIASLESFIDALKLKEPAKNADIKLRVAFLDLMERLSMTPVIPSAFKNALDERSLLFLGFRQQDSHEFLTTLLNLLDEDYKIEKNEEEIKKGSIEVQDELSEVSADLENVICKKPRTDESATNDSSFSVHLPVENDSCLSAKSYLELDMDAIGRLLHGDCSADVILSEVSTTSIVDAEQPRYKLIGGRMNTTDVVLTPYNEYAASKHQTRNEQATSIRSDATDESAENDGDASTAMLPSPIDTMFTTQVRVRLTCDSCKYTRCHKETYLHLSLEIGSISNICSNVEDSLRRFFAPCTQELKCEKCFCATASQTTEITKLPLALLLHFKRFIVDVSPDWSDVTCRKNQSAVLFDEDLSFDEDVGALFEFLAPECSFPDTVCRPRKYELRSVVNHIGSSANCGHYTADAKRLEGEKRKWMRFNDSHVYRISAAAAIEQSRQTAYMCLYELE